MMLAGHIPELAERDPKPTNLPIVFRWPEPPPRPKVIKPEKEKKQWLAPPPPKPEPPCVPKPKQPPPTPVAVEAAPLPAIAADPVQSTRGCGPQIEHHTPPPAEVVLPVAPVPPARRRNEVAAGVRTSLARRKHPKQLAGFPACITALIWRIAREHGVPAEQIVGRRRDKSTARARHRMWLIVRDTLDLSFPEMGRLFGVDHSTICHAVKAQIERGGA